MHRSLVSMAMLAVLCLLASMQIPTTSASTALWDAPANLTCQEAFVALATTSNTTRVMLAMMFDATGKSLDDLGKWDQCRDLGEDVAHYCVVRFAVPVSLTAESIGTCLPAQCNTTDIQDLINTAINIANLTVQNWNVTQFPALVNISTEAQEIAEKLIAAYGELILYEKGTTKYDYYCPQPAPSIESMPGSVMMVFVSFVLVGFVIVGTALDGYESKWWPEKSSAEGSSIGSIQDDAEAKPLLHSKPEPKSKWFQFLTAFSLVKNFNSLVGPSPPGLAFLNGMRAISILWVILGHSLVYLGWAGVVNYAHVVTVDVLKTSAQVFPAAEFSVDSFFWLSGFLVAYLTINELKTKRRVNWVLYYFHRVWRLSPAYYYALFFYMYIAIHLGSGPMWPTFEQLIQNTCTPNWWANVLYINNFIPSLWANQCMVWSWYLAVDMQLYIVGPIIFFIYYKNKAAGWSIVIALIVACTVVNGVLAHVKHLIWDNADNHVYMSNVYGKPYTRASPWLLGIACAFLYLEKKKLRAIEVYIGWVLSAVVMVLCVYGPVTEFSKSPNPVAAPINNWGSDSNLMYFTFAKLGWSLALSFIMYSMTQGYGGFVRRFLGAHFWSPLARLTYSTYLFHPIVIYVTYYSHLQMFSYDNFSFGINFVGISVISFGMAVIMFLALERPMVNMEKLFLPHKKH